MENLNPSNEGYSAPQEAEEMIKFIFHGRKRLKYTFAYTYVVIKCDELLLYAVCLGVCSMYSSHDII